MKDIDEIGVPVQMLAPEYDEAYPSEMKRHTFDTAMKKGLYFDYAHFPGTEHGGLVRGDEKKKGEREAMARAKNLAVSWMKQFLCD